MQARKFFANNVVSIAEVAAAVWVGSLFAGWLNGSSFFEDLPSGLVDLAVALVAATLVVAIREFVFALPGLRMQWVAKGRELPHDVDLIEMPFTDQVGVFAWSLQLHKEVDSKAVAPAILRLLARLGVRLELRFSPGHALYVTVDDSKSGRARGFEDRVVFDLRAMSPDAGTAEWALLLFEPGNLPADPLDVRCSYRLIFERRVNIIVRPLVRVSGTVSRLSTTDARS